MDRPNVLFIMADQYRHDYLGCAGAEFVRTPNLDAIAARGMRFTQCATNSPVCAPARIGLATGLQPARVGSLDNRSFLPHSVPTYYQRLRDHGYRVGCVGKLDLAKPDGYNGRFGDRPCVFGWGFTHPEECEGKMHAGQSPEPRGPYGLWLREQGLYEAFHADYKRRAQQHWIRGVSHDSVLPAEAFEDVYIGRRAAEWIERIPSDFPWHLFVSFVGPHDPFDPPTDYAERYRQAAMPAPVPISPNGKPDWIVGRRRAMEPEEVAHTRRQYCAAIACIDDQVGRILLALERRGMADNTILVFSSDHGEMLADHGLYTKSVPYEGALRVPLMVAGAGIPAGAVSAALVELIDVNPTICELAGLPPQEHIDARSLGPVLRGAAAQHRADTVSAMPNFRCIRTRRHKLVLNYNAGTECYNLESDPGEQHNIARDDPALAQRLTRRLQARFQEGRWLR
ncbi:MAG: sulfatase-like hydrolase/transferase [Kiritimatiellae bacterium]|nr:sulfatase-like hydrolase/transferase [Kiritimatiellia bacterium]